MPWQQRMARQQRGAWGSHCLPHTPCHARSLAGALAAAAGNGAVSHLLCGRIRSAPGWWWQSQRCCRAREALCCSARKGPDPSLSVASSGTWIATRPARGVWPCWWAAAQCHWSPSHALQPGKSPAATSPFRLPPRQAALGRGASCATGWEPTAPPLTPKCASSGLRAPTLPPN